MEASDAREEHLIETERAHGAIAIGIGIDEHFAIGEHGVVHRVPVAAEVVSDLGDRTREAADLHRRPPSRTRRHRHARRSNARVLLGPGGLLTVRLGTAEASLVPAQSRRSSEAREIDEGDDALLLQLDDDTALRAADGHAAALEVDFGDRPVEHAEHHYVGETDEDLAHPLGVALEAAKHLLS